MGIDVSHRRWGDVGIVQGLVDGTYNGGLVGKREVMGIRGPPDAQDLGSGGSGRGP